MRNILIPLAGKSLFFDEADFIFPKPLVEINAKPMIELVINNLSQIKGANFIFVLKESDVKRYFLDDTIKLLASEAKFVIIKDETMGAACSAMLAIDYIDNENELIICNGDQIIEQDLEALLIEFNGADAGVLCFESIHPRYAYVRLDGQNFIQEAFEKKPVSKDAVAGFFYFKKGRDFLRACELMILKDASFEGKFWLSLSLNELILQNKILKAVHIDKNAYHTFYSPKKIAEFESLKKGLKV